MPARGGDLDRLSCNLLPLNKLQVVLRRLLADQLLVGQLLLRGDPGLAAQVIDRFLEAGSPLLAVQAGITRALILRDQGEFGAAAEQIDSEGGGFFVVFRLIGL